MPDWKVFSTTFAFVFLAELGDKTQLATLLFSAQQPQAKWLVFGGSAAALILAAGIGVLAGGWLSNHVPEKTLKLVAGLGFVAMGLWTLKGALTG